jgi:hypothetical protein
VVRLEQVLEAADPLPGVARASHALTIFVPPGSAPDLLVSEINTQETRIKPPQTHMDLHPCQGVLEPRTPRCGGNASRTEGRAVADPTENQRVGHSSSATHHSVARQQAAPSGQPEENESQPQEGSVRPPQEPRQYVPLQQESITAGFAPTVAHGSSPWESAVESMTLASASPPSASAASSSGSSGDGSTMRSTALPPHPDDRVPSRRTTQTTSEASIGAPAST